MKYKTLKNYNFTLNAMKNNINAIKIEYRLLMNEYLNY